MKKIMVLLLAAMLALLRPPALAADAPGGTLMVYDGAIGMHGVWLSVLGNPEIGRDQVKSVTFLSDLSGAPDSAWDVSENRDGSVLSWAEQDGDLYNLFIAANGPVRLNRDSSGLFKDFSSATAIRFGGAADTSGVTDMSGMFGACYRLADLDVTGFDTASVTDMGRMFDSCFRLTKLDVTGFDTGNVTNMRGMFALCGSLKSLDLSGFIVDEETDTSDMFYGCDALTDLKMPE